MKFIKEINSAIKYIFLILTIINTKSIFSQAFIEYYYDNQNRLKELSYNNCATIIYNYDEVGNITNINLSKNLEVISTEDDYSNGTLRVKVDCAGDGEIITFHSSLFNQNIFLQEGTIELDKDITIQSDIGDVSVFSNTPGQPVFLVPDGITAHIMGVNIRANTGNCAIENHGIILLEDSDLLYTNIDSTPCPIMNFGELLIKGIVKIRGY